MARRLGDHSEDEEGVENAPEQPDQPVPPAQAPSAEDEEAQLEQLAAEGLLGVADGDAKAEDDGLDSSPPREPEPAPRKPKRTHFASDDVTGDGEGRDLFAAVLSKVRQRRELLGQPAPLEFDAQATLRQIELECSSDSKSADDVVVMPTGMDTYCADDGYCSDDEGDEDADSDVGDGETYEEGDELDADRDDDELREERRQERLRQRADQEAANRDGAAAVSADADAERDSASDNDGEQRADDQQKGKTCEAGKQDTDHDHGDAAACDVPMEARDESKSGEAHNDQGHYRKAQELQQHKQDTKDPQIAGEEEEGFVREKSESEDEPPEEEDEELRDARQKQLREMLQDDGERGNADLEEEAEMSEDGGHTDDEDTRAQAYDEEVLADIAAADATKETAASKDKRSELHAQWAEENEQKEMEQLIEAYKSGFKKQRKRSRRGILDEGDEDEWQRMRRAEDESENEDGSDDDENADRIAPAPLDTGQNDDFDEEDDKENEVGNATFGRSANENQRRIALDGSAFDILDRVVHSSAKQAQSFMRHDTSRGRFAGRFSRSAISYDQHQPGQSGSGRAFFHNTMKERPLLCNEATTFASARCCLSPSGFALFVLCMVCAKQEADKAAEPSTANPQDRHPQQQKCERESESNKRRTGQQPELIKRIKRERSCNSNREGLAGTDDALRLLQNLTHQ